jgi:trypsin-like peptidase/effector-associated domain 1 (EAD1)-containing protein
MPPNTAETEFEDALIDAFNLDEMTRMVRRHLGLVLERELDVHQGTRDIFGKLLGLAVRQGFRDELVRGALIENPKNPRLRKAAAALNIPLTVPPSAPPTGSIRVDDLDRGRLEKTARERGVSVNFDDYNKRLNAMARRMCLIEIPTDEACGTGWLVGPDRVLTNYHVVEEVHKNGVPASEVTCRFDYFVDKAEGVPCGLGANWLEDWSPYALGDQRADAAEPTVDELDYALIRLARKVGDEDVAGSPRGWISVRIKPPVMVAEDIVMIPQFPDGRALELSFGKALAYNNAATRLRYDANTEEGASGSPALTMTLEPFGLHHAGGPARSQKFNQCVPLRLVIGRLTDRKIHPFWQE